MVRTKYCGVIESILLEWLQRKKQNIFQIISIEHKVVTLLEWKVEISIRDRYIIESIPLK